jgi:formylmethanofuran dehydrogenase subunit C
LKLKLFMDRAYQGKAMNRQLDTHKGEIIFSLDDLFERAGKDPTKADVERLMPTDGKLLSRLIEEDPGKKLSSLWGYLTSLAAERSAGPLKLLGLDFAGRELSSGVIILEEGADHIGEGMKGGRIVVLGEAGDFLGQAMAKGGIVAESCGDYAFRNMCGGFGVIKKEAGNYLGLRNSGGRILVKENAGARAGWLMRAGRLVIKGDAGDYLGLLMSGGKITVCGAAGARTGWRMKGGIIYVSEFGPEMGEGAVGGKILEKGFPRDP